MKSSIIRCVGCLALALASACGGDRAGAADAGPADGAPPVDLSSFAFMEGDWEVSSRVFGGDGGEVETTARASIEPALGVAWKAQWVGTRDGAAAEIRSLLGPSDRPDAWLMVRGDGAAGTFDVLEGNLDADPAVFVSREGSRPDGGTERVTLADVARDRFTLTVERSSDGGDTWTLREEMIYRRAGAEFSLPAPPASAAGCTDAAYRAFDFWAGDWTVGAARNDLRMLLAGCILEENWMATVSGTSFNMYDRRTEQWTQVWMASNRNTLVLYGGPSDDQMILQGPQGDTEQRITWTPNEDGTVRQHGEASPDDGATWMTLYDLTYTPR